MKIILKCLLNNEKFQGPFVENYKIPADSLLVKYRPGRDVTNSKAPFFKFFVK